MAETDHPLHRTTLHSRHVALGAKMVPFAGYDMPVQYPMGVMAEHNWTRENAGLFDVSHMGQCFLIPEDGQFETVARAFEKLVPADVVNLKPGQQRYSQFTNEQGGILDDLMITRLGLTGHEHWLYVVVNAACKEQDFDYIEQNMPKGIRFRRADDLALVALQGPKAVEVLADHIPSLKTLPFMMSTDEMFHNIWCHISRTGYSGEDGVEISVKNEEIGAFVDILLKDGRVKPIGLGARDSLRLEAGLCLYGHDIDTTTTPIEGDLLWSIQKRRREEGGFPGAAIIQKQIKEGVARKRVGILPDGRAPAREGTVVKATDGTVIGAITSGGFGPTAGGPIAMGYINSRFTEAGTPVLLEVRGKDLPAKIVKLPFVPHRYYRG